MSILDSPGAVRFAKINATEPGETVLAPGVSGKKIRLLSVFLIPTGSATTQQLKSETTNVFGPLNLTSNRTFRDQCPWGLVEIPDGESLTFTTTGTGAVSGWATYQLVD